MHEYNDKFTRCLEKIKRRHDPTVTTVAQGILEWKRSQNTALIGHGVQAFLDRFYMTRWVCKGRGTIGEAPLD